MRNSIVVISSYERGEYFFSTDHCQDHGLGDDFVRVTNYLPMHVVPREGLEDGIIDTVEKLVFIFHHGETEIKNPNPKFQPDFN